MFIDLPQDILLGIMRHVEPQDLLAARQTCKVLYQSTEDRLTWVYALQDILSISPHPALIEALPSMSMVELKKNITKSAQLLQADIKPI
ncbi:hypothetical protein JAAARDRAFT_39678 [Jaapia argillacea MUCL 33604]|uniref:F-box domain-containing protein n=1 Tax=Jaapia argillacea MUCL 33604 TaxID=933084 RepID=A0A067PDZ5_9AGAM|nr:hypothetical protein JAAARDRAFT_39678 [Jaapia argillacea MUCL 33604]